ADDLPRMAAHQLPDGRHAAIELRDELATLVVAQRAGGRPQDNVLAVGPNSVLRQLLDARTIVRRPVERLRWRLRQGDGEQPCPQQHGRHVMAPFCLSSSISKATAD